MGFKLGTSRQPYAVDGEIKSKLRFHTEVGDPDISVPGTPIVRVPLEDSVLGEANMDGSIYISDKITPGSDLEKQVTKHEMKHATDLKIGKLEYGDDYVKYNGETFSRETIQGKDMILFNGEWTEAGSDNFPWEKEADANI